MLNEYTLPDGWRWARLEDVAAVILSNVDKKVSPDEQAVRLCNYTDVYYNRYISRNSRLSSGSATSREVKRFSLRAGDVVITKDSEDRHDIAVPALVVEDLPQVLCGYHLAIVRPNNGSLCGGYMAALLQHHPTRHLFSRLANGVTRFGLTSEAIAHAHLPVPPIQEQEYIASVIQTVDDSIKAVERLIKRQQRLKRGLMQKLLFGRQRFAEFAQPWQSVRIGDLLQDTNRSITLEDNTEYRLVSIRRRSGGLFDREVRQGRDIGYARLKTIKTGDFVIARRQILHGAMTMAPAEFDGAFVSDAYCTLVPRNAAKFHMPFFHYLSQTPLMYYKAYRCSYGVAIEKMFFNLKWFLDEEILLPPTVDEQRRIADTLKCVDDEIAQLRRQLEAFKAQKKGLMQKLLTGQIRVAPKGARHA